MGNCGAFITSMMLWKVTRCIGSVLKFSHANAICTENVGRDPDRLHRALLHPSLLLNVWSARRGAGLARLSARQRPACAQGEKGSTQQVDGPVRCELGVAHPGQEEPLRRRRRAGRAYDRRPRARRASRRDRAGRRQHRATSPRSCAPCGAESHCRAPGAATCRRRAQRRVRERVRTVPPRSGSTPQNDTKSCVPTRSRAARSSKRRDRAAGGRDATNAASAPTARAGSAPRMCTCARLQRGARKSRRRTRAASRAERSAGNALLSAMRKPLRRKPSWPVNEMT